MPPDPEVALDGDHSDAAGLRIVRSTHVEALLAPLIAQLRHSSADVFTPVRIVVASRGMQRWLTHQIAQGLSDAGHGIAANIDFPFPGRMIDEVVGACTGSGEGDPWEPRTLAWSVAALFTSHAHAPAMASLGDAIGDSIVDRPGWRLARRVADVFNGYALTRPEMVAAWSAGDDVDDDARPLGADDRWQPWLWRRLVAELGDPTARLGTTIERLRDGSAAGLQLPREVTLFGLTTLPRRHLEVLAALAGHRPVTLYLPTPSASRWRRCREAASTGGAIDEAAHPMLLSCGRLADDAATLVTRLAPAHHDMQVDPPDAAYDDASRTLLGRIQQGLREDEAPPSPDAGEDALRVRGAEGDVAAAAVDPAAWERDTDRTLQVHRCYGPSRQAEVLRDAIFALLADDATLEPRDVIVLTPDVATFAPLVQAAFAADGHRPDLPVEVADRRVGDGDVVASICLTLLGLAAGRVTASELLDLLARDAVAAMFGISHTELPQLRRWVAETGVRWGIDAHHRAVHGQPADHHHTWRAGLDRLLIGVTMADEDDRVVGGLAPFDHVEGDDVELAGRFAEAVSIICRLLQELSGPRPVADWCTTIRAAVRRCVQLPPDDAWRLHAFEDRLDELAADAHAADVRADPVILDLGGITAALAAALDQTRGATGYETGAVTLCELVPMRSIPHRVVCLLGVDDGVFPRRSDRVGFDLVDRHRHLGDRDRRDEDRHLFLEAVLAARDHLVVVCAGWDARTNESRPMAVPVAELVEVTLRTAAAIGVDPDTVVRDHSLHPFSPSAFTPDHDGRPFSFDVTRLAAARRLHDPGRRPRVFVDGPLAPPQDDGDPISLDDLVDAAVHPVRHLLRDRLELHLTERDEPLDDDEPLTLDALERSGVGRLLLDVDTNRVQRRLHALQATGTVPAGTPGQVAVDAVAREVAELRAFAESRAAELLGATPEDARQGDVAMEIPLDDRMVRGTVDAMFGPVVGADPSAIGGALRLEVAFRRDGPRPLLSCWVRHLALACHGMTDTVTVAVLRAKSGSGQAVKVLAPLAATVDDPDAFARLQLTELVALRDQALREPLPLFTSASYKYASTGRMSAAEGAFWDGFRSQGDRDVYIEQVYGAEATLSDVLADEDAARQFRMLAEQLWHPVLEHLERSKQWHASRHPTEGSP